MSQLVILRGNSASGKTTTAKAIQAIFPRGQVMKISQDDVRLRILNVKDRVENPTASLIQQIALFGKEHADIVLIGGILGAHIYQAMFCQLYKKFAGNVLTYYYDLTFEETLIRHSQRELSNVFGADRMKRWWLDHDVLGFPNEKLLTADLSQEQVIAVILKALDLAKEKS